MLRHRVPRDPRHQDLISSERLSEGRPSFVSDTHDEKKVDAEACGSSDTTLGGVAEKVCMLPDSPASVTETFVQSLPGEVAGAATSWHYYPTDRIQHQGHVK